jgi:hypothetical protein
MSFSVGSAVNIATPDGIKTGKIVQQLFLVKNDVGADGQDYYFGITDENYLKRFRSPAYVTSMIVPSKGGSRRTRRNKKRATRRRRA